MSSARDAALQVELILDDVAHAITHLEGIEEKLNTIEGGAMLLGLTQSNNQGVSAVIEVVEAAKRNRETLWRFMFNIQQRLNEYLKKL
jgi:hypothetical protein